ncbi:hypothetical protein TVAG_397140 [Trichomonas vaginalis G3]|uniref:Uncharacterized protein n=1 Tax=Trichomonas vaginalis (strain ATCC PRA-98 / G3) TaxID=412133 RepID=A2DXA1_TRIV3|nr:hypothetical protein TVAGG3_0673060 [Trichomonas vaginalis G3]EAY14983.1 hypothetical protein TVAG_397140 [Trichomonas vaginalis G3]KAI5507340.1 hypothetical protein TVAGG3_0673060 [Trichomonas vaginalis G3]|eukprot:XP_001327206.1 hypothetical protein [Trichomonas vaginalis G3]
MDKTAARFLKISKRFGRGETSVHLIRTFIKLNDTRKAAKWLSQETNSTLAILEQVKFILEGRLVKRNYTILLSKLKKLPKHLVVFLLPNIAYRVGYDLIYNTKEALYFLDHAIGHDLIAFIVLFTVLTILLRYRLKIVIDLSNHD